MSARWGWFRRAAQVRLGREAIEAAKTLERVTFERHERDLVVLTTFEKTGQRRVRRPRGPTSLQVARAVAAALRAALPWATVVPQGGDVRRGIPITLTVEDRRQLRRGFMAVVTLRIGRAYDLVGPRTSGVERALVAFGLHRAAPPSVSGAPKRSGRFKIAMQIVRREVAARRRRAALNESVMGH